MLESSQSHQHLHPDCLCLADTGSFMLGSSQWRTILAEEWMAFFLASKLGSLSHLNRLWVALLTDTLRECPAVLLRSLRIYKRNASNVAHWHFERVACFVCVCLLNGLRIIFAVCMGITELQKTCQKFHIYRTPWRYELEVVDLSNASTMQRVRFWRFEEGHVSEVADLKDTSKWCYAPEADDQSKTLCSRHE